MKEWLGDWNSILINRISLYQNMKQPLKVWNNNQTYKAHYNYALSHAVTLTGGIGFQVYLGCILIGVFHWLYYGRGMGFHRFHFTTDKPLSDNSLSIKWNVSISKHSKYPEQTFTIYWGLGNWWNNHNNKYMGISQFLTRDPCTWEKKEKKPIVWPCFCFHCYAEQ